MSAAQNQANTLSQAKRKLEGTIAHMQEEAEDLENEAKNADDRAKKAAIEVRAFKISRKIKRCNPKNRAKNMCGYTLFAELRGRDTWELPRILRLF